MMLHGVEGLYSDAESLADVHPVSSNLVQKEIISLYQPFLMLVSVTDVSDRRGERNLQPPTC